MTEFNVLAAAADGKLPDWIRLLPLGEVKLSDGREPFTVDRTSVETVVQEFRARGIDLVVDYEHQSLGRGRAPAAGWIKVLESRPDGLWGQVQWTPQAAAYLQDREYRYFSPVLRLDPETRKPVTLLHVGLTNTPAINHLTPLVAKAEADKQDKPIQEATAMLKKLIARLGLRPETTEEEVLALVAERVQEAVALKAQTAVLPEIAAVLALKADASASEIIGTIKGLKGNQDRLSAVETELIALKQAQAVSEAEAAVDAAITARKISPAMREIKLKQARRDLAEFKAEMAVAPVILADALKPAKDGGGQDGLDAEQVALCASAGIKPEAFKISREQLIGQGLLKGEG